MNNALRVKEVEAQCQLLRNRSHIFWMGRFERHHYVQAICHHEREHKAQMGPIRANMLELI